MAWHCNGSFYRGHICFLRNLYPVSHKWHWWWQFVVRHIQEFSLTPLSYLLWVLVCKSSQHKVHLLNQFSVSREVVQTRLKCCVIAFKLSTVNRPIVSAIQDRFIFSPHPQPTLTPAWSICAWCFSHYCTLQAARLLWWLPQSVWWGLLNAWSSIEDFYNPGKFARPRTALLEKWPYDGLCRDVNTGNSPNHLIMILVDGFFSGSPAHK